MRASYLVDGYNLLFHLGLFDRRLGTSALEQARERLLDYLKQALKNEDVTVVFDSARGRKTAPALQVAGLNVQYAQGESADDVIEKVIAACADPRQLVVISNDHRI